MSRTEPRVIKLAETKLDHKGVQQLAEHYGAVDWLNKAKQIERVDAEFLIELAGRACFDSQTEILTDDGWKLGVELNGSEKVATWNHVAGRTEFQPYDFFCYHYEGRMLAIEQQHLDLVVTSDHRLYVQEKRGRGWTKFFITYANDLNRSKRYGFRTVGSRISGNVPEFVQIEGVQLEQLVANQYGTYGARTNTSEGFAIAIIPYLRLLGFYISEGALHEQKDAGRGILLYQIPGLILDGMVSVVNEIGLPFHTRTDTRNGVVQLAVGGGTALCNHFRKFGTDAKSKRLTREILNLDSSLLEILFEAMWKGDGSYARNGSRLYHTSSERLADDVQEILFKTGRASSITVSHFRDGRTMYLVRELKRRNNPVAKSEHRKWWYYKGKVWCVTTPNGIIYVRRNKKPVWCGNCYKSFGTGLNPNITKIREDPKEYISNVLKSKHGSVIEHASVTFAFLDVSRIFTHELVRHRAGTAISQESLRYVRPREINLWLPPDIEAVSKSFLTIVEDIKKGYRNLEASFPWDEMSFEQKKRVTSALRRILPDGMATNVIWTANHRTIRWVIEMRTDPSAEVEIRKVFGLVAEICIRDYPNLYADFSRRELPDGTYQYVPEFSKV